MGLSKMLERLDLESWGDHAQPPENALGAVPAALRAIADPEDLDRGRTYHGLLYALGNDHAGTYFPVVVPAILVLGEILRGGVLVARLRALDVLIDLIGSFEPDPAYEEVETSSGRRPLSAVVKEAVSALSNDVEVLHRGPGSDEEESLSAELLALIRE